MHREAWPNGVPAQLPRCRAGKDQRKRQRIDYDPDHGAIEKAGGDERSTGKPPRRNKKRHRENSTDEEVFRNERPTIRFAEDRDDDQLSIDIYGKRQTRFIKYPERAHRDPRHQTREKGATRSAHQSPALRRASTTGSFSFGSLYGSFAAKDSTENFGLIRRSSFA